MKAHVVKEVKNFQPQFLPKAVSDFTTPIIEESVKAHAVNEDVIEESMKARGESLSKAWTRFKDLLKKVPRHGIDLCSKFKYFMTMSIPPQGKPSIKRLVCLFSQVDMDDSNLTMEEYIELEAKKGCRRGQTFNKETATDFPAIVVDDPLGTDHKISPEPRVSPLDDSNFDFKISFDESDDEDYIVIYDKNSFSYKLISVNKLKMDSENDNIKVNASSGDIVIEQSKNEFCGPSQWKELSKEISSKILPGGDRSCRKMFKPIASLIAKGKLK
nr:hypothetical protein [Tanacetum cinerariifolium]